MYAPGMPPSSTIAVDQRPQVVQSNIQSYPLNGSQTQLTRHPMSVSTTTNNQSNPLGMRPNVPYSSNSTQQNGVWSSQSAVTSTSPSHLSGPLNVDSGPPSLQHAISSNSLAANQNHISNVANSSSQLQNQNAQNTQPQIDTRPPTMGPSFMAGGQVNAGPRPLYPNTQTNALPPQGGMQAQRQGNSSIRQRYPNMMPPPISSNQPTMQPNLPASNTNSSVQQTFGYSSPQGYPPTSSASSPIHQSTPAGFPPQPISNQSISGRPNQGMPPPMPATSSISQRIGGLSLSHGADAIDLLQNRHILPSRGTKVPVPKPRLQAELWNSYNCSADVFRSTLTKVGFKTQTLYKCWNLQIFYCMKSEAQLKCNTPLNLQVPETEALLKKSRLPLGVLIHPFRDLSHLPVIQCATIVRCRQCRTYINPFVHFVDQRRLV